MLNTVIIKDEFIEEDLSSSIDGSNTIFNTSYNYESETIEVYLNGLKLRRGISNDFDELSNDEIIMSYSPLVGDVLTVNYIKK